MRSQLNPLSRLNSDSKPAPWLPAPDFAPQQRRTHHPTGVAALLNEVRAANEVRPPVTKTRLQTQNEERQARESQRKAEFERQRSRWDPLKDANIHGDPYSTIIVARLQYSVTEDQLRLEFAQYGRIECVRVVPNRGYAFVVYDNAQAARLALQNTANGVSLQGRRIITDLEKGRIQKGWLPRRLGGGLGGRFSLARQKAEMQRAQHIQRSFRAQKRDSRGNTRSYDALSKRDGRELGRRDMRRGPPSYDPRRSPVPVQYETAATASGTATANSPQTNRHEPAGRALRRY